MNVFTSLGTPARRTRTAETSASPLPAEAREVRPAPTAEAQRSSSQTTTVASGKTQT